MPRSSGALFLMALLAACTSSFTVKVGDWTATCTGVSAAECEGVAGLFVNNLARNSPWVRSESGGKVSVDPRRSCPKVPDWADPTSCWEASATVSAGAVCMVIARQADPATADLGFGQVGGDEMSGRAGGSPEGWPLCD